MCKDINEIFLMSYFGLYATLKHKYIKDNKGFNLPLLSLMYLNDSLANISGDTGWITLNSTYTTRYRKKNGYVTICSTVQNTIQSTITIGVLPAGYRPITELTTIDSVQGGLRLSAIPSGDVRIAPVANTADRGYCYATITYPV